MKEEKFAGRVHTVIFENIPETFYILKMVMDPDPDENALGLEYPNKALTVRGNIPGISVGIGTWFAFKGKRVKHPKFGSQVEIIRAPIMDEGWSAGTALDTLQTHGVSRVLLNKILKTVGEDRFIDVISERQELEKVSGISEIEIDQVVTRWRAVVSMFASTEFLSEAGIPNRKIAFVQAKFGDETQEVLSKDPWRLVEVDGISFKVADSVAARLGLDVSHENPRRVRGAVLYASKTSIGMGHLYQETSAIFGAVKKLDASFTTREVAVALASLHNEKKLFVDRKTNVAIRAVYSPWLYAVEQKSAEMLASRIKSAAVRGKNITQYKRDLLGLVSSEKPPRSALRKVAASSVDLMQKALRIDLTKDQREGVLNAIVEPVSIITGLPGTGKSTSLKIAVHVLIDAGCQVLLVAPTGIAAKRMASVTGNPAYTIHRALGAKGSSKSSRKQTYAGVVGATLDHGSADKSEWTKNEDTPHNADVVIVDESSMVDQSVLYRLLAGTKNSCRVVFVGDAAQLPSVGPGNVLRDMVESNKFPTVQLTEIFRQENTSDIIRAAHDIHAGITPGYSGKEFRLLLEDDEDKVFECVTKLAEKLYEKRRQFQILSPRHKGTLGVTNLNENLRELLNPKQPGYQEVRIGREMLRENDRVMIVKNDYALEVFNGDTGKIARFEQKDREVEVKVHGPPVVHIRIPYEKVPPLLRMAYAITVHKSQGMEYDVIIMPIVDGFRHQLQRNLLYTAVTRACKMVILVGTRSALEKAVKNNREDQRNTLFRTRLEQEIS